MARWEWVRWIQATRNPATRRRRVEASVSKLDGGKRRPWCFDRSSCAAPALARSGKLRSPSLYAAGPRARAVRSESDWGGHH
ncbi:YdeI/OmpD-associated family protein [Ornithinimicrobium pratense]|uniref:YdeI/OmpD-associated family protein n=1 Tax=Ornithinimicrobium pratense TaxID=2593973 RepID=A0A5J6V6I1_9MICO|nr:YdeI/OmpD-associated family protein [Ornithinimicrobium pratense]